MGLAAEKPPCEATSLHLLLMQKDADQLVLSVAIDGNFCRYTAHVCNCVGCPVTLANCHQIKVISLNTYEEVPMTFKFTLSHQCVSVV